MPLPKVVIVGRPNVGKSSLFNWIAGRRIAIVEDIPGVTRDRVSTLVQLDSDEPLFFELVDTGGIGIIDREELSEHVEKQIAIALEEADIILFVVDVREGRMPLDEEVATKLRYLDKPVILVVNKADVPALDDRGHEFARFGRGTPVYVSTRENRGKNDLMELIAEKLPRWDQAPPGNPVMKLAVVGRPNTGKSTFINQLAQAERMIVSEIAGTTRDSVDIRFELDGHPFLAIDTAGVRRQAKLRDSIDFFSLHRAQRSIRRADVVLLFFDPTQGITRLDKQLADYIAEQYKPCIFTVNKWDLIVADMRSDENAPPDAAQIVMKRFVNGIQYEFRTMAYMPIAFITAQAGRNVKALINTAQALFKQANQRVGTGMLNRVLRQAVESHPPPMRQNRVPKIYFATQVGVAPPTIVLFVNSPSLFDPTYQRYLLNAFRKYLPLADVPIKLYLRARKQEEGGSGRKRAEDDDAPTTEEIWLQNQEVNEFLNDLNDKDS